MLFTSLAFWPFLAAVGILHCVVPRRYRWLLLLLASYCFYAQLGWGGIAILVAITLINYGAAIAIAGSSGARRRRLWLTASICATLLPLVLLKYSVLLLDSLRMLVVAPSLADAGSSLLHLALPIGISFYTFQALGYTIDVYRGTIPAEKHLGRFALYVSFFPQILSGPIGRGRDMLGQYLLGGRPGLERISEGAKLVLWGLFQKVVVADRLAIYVDKVYTDPSAYSGTTLLLACYLFSFQIYCDFAGYSNIAIGVARILGYDLMQNFRLPCFASSITDFWRRWHISLTSWFRDYLYIPCGGNRTSVLRWCRNILLVFLLSGLWHGANWTFLVWGGVHAVFYLVERLRLNVTKAPSRVSTGVRRVVGGIITFHVVTFAWIFFRSPSLSVAGEVLHGIVTLAAGPLYRGPSQLTTVLSLIFVAVLLAVEYAQLRGLASLHGSPSRLSRPIRWGGYVAMIMAIAIFGMSRNAFIYFQF
jgi:alginate O-acetyltransferase complex protein AlgI